MLFIYRESDNFVEGLNLDDDDDNDYGENGCRERQGLTLICAERGSMLLMDCSTALYQRIHAIQTMMTMLVMMVTAKMTMIMRMMTINAGGRRQPRRSCFHHADIHHIDMVTNTYLTNKMQVLTFLLLSKR